MVVEKAPKASKEPGITKHSCKVDASEVKGHSRGKSTTKADAAEVKGHTRGKSTAKANGDAK